MIRLQKSIKEKIKSIQVNLTYPRPGIGDINNFTKKKPKQITKFKVQQLKVDDNKKLIFKKNFKKIPNLKRVDTQNWQTEL